MKQIFNNPKTLRLIIIVLSVFFLAVCADLYRGLTQEEVIIPMSMNWRTLWNIRAQYHKDMM